MYIAAYTHTCYSFNKIVLSILTPSDARLYTINLTSIQADHDNFWVGNGQAVDYSDHDLIQGR